MTLTVWAIIQAHEGHSKQATEYLALAETYPTDGTGWMRHWALLDRVKADLGAALGAEGFATAWERGASLDLAPVVERILTEHEDTEG